ncbi:multicopper oxidase domain-containing protein [Corynebacterium phoceense]|uniref:multicopper oxidase domain-containing protein n=1 Tax=Corynebacterium phoceense TaxID=1686286 RepID=UPI00211C8FAB|nr:multicopper oxidase domain-containing protein [Corynebacterium phoceense]MCQ9346570.1 multicopper oxidase domain-containing protein [Corynebacterium phoceense]
MTNLMSPQPSQPSQPSQPAKSNANGWAAWLLIGLAIAAVVVLAVVNTTATNKASSPAAPVAASGDDVVVDVTVDGMAFVPNSVDVPAGSRLIVNFTNTGDKVHDLKIGDNETGRIEPGKSAQLDAGVITEDIKGICTIAGHEMQGMTFMVHATGANSEASSGEHNHAVAGASNPFVTVPSAADRTKKRDDFEARDAALAPSTGTVHEETWEMTEEVREVAPGVKQVQWLFNGQAPGPTLHGKVGDTFKITLVNNGTMGHSVDFHAGEVNPDTTMATIEPGEELTYEFTANRSGIWMYHCSTDPMSLHIANGMMGAVIIDPVGDDALSDVDGEYTFVASDVFLGDQAIGADPDRVANGDFDLMAFNGYPNQYDLEPLHAKVGETVRLWVLNVGPDQPLSFHVVGEQFDTVYKEGTYLIRDEKQTGSQALDLLPAQGGFVEMTFNEPGTYSFVNHIMTNAEKGQHGKIIVTE